MADGLDIPARSGRSPLDLATVVGLGGAALLIGVALLLGGSAASFVDVPAVLIVIGGTALVTTACFSLGDMRRTVSVLRTTVRPSPRQPEDAAVRVLGLADVARRQGLLKMQGPALDLLRRDPILHKGLSLVIDGLPEAEVEAILRHELTSAVHRSRTAVGVLRKAAEIAPAMGLIGTLIGLVQMLGNLDDPSTIGPSMAVALLTTFYGAILGTVVFTPLASKLERNAADEHLVARVHLLGVLSIGRKDNPRRLEMQINSVLPPGSRVSVFD
jgi:chemotaxis protein MotA